MFTIMGILLGAKMGLDIAAPLPWEKETIWTAFARMLMAPLHAILFGGVGYAIDTIFSFIKGAI